MPIMKVRCRHCVEHTTRVGNACSMCDPHTIQYPYPKGYLMSGATMAPNPDDLKVKLLGQVVGGFTIVKYIDRGASALVFEGHDAEGVVVAIKIFDPEFIAKHGDDVQVKRIERQLLLKGKEHKHLIKVIDGGQCASTKLHYLVMPFLPTPSLDKTLDRIPVENIWPIISQLAEVAKFLEDINMCHRDIKPANVVVTGANFDNAVLLDLGVLSPLGVHDLTDTTGGKGFVGTIRYSPPEFLLRDEDESVEGYRAVTFYQIGGVLHDLIMKRPLFDDKSKPHARLIKAVLLEEPTISSSEVPYELVRLAKKCLVKDPEKRAKSLDWTDFVPKASKLPSINEAQLRSAQLRRAIGGASANRPDFVERGQIKETLNSLKERLKQVCITDSTTFAPNAIAIHEFASNQWIVAAVFGVSPEHGFLNKFACYFSLTVQDSSFVTFSVAAAAAINPPVVLAEIKLAEFKAIGEAVTGPELAQHCERVLYASVVSALTDTVTGIGSIDGTQWVPIEGL